MPFPVSGNAFQFLQNHKVRTWDAFQLTSFIRLRWWSMIVNYMPSASRHFTTHWPLVRTLPKCCSYYTSQLPISKYVSLVYEESLLLQEPTTALLHQYFHARTNRCGAGTSIGRPWKQLCLASATTCPLAAYPELSHKESADYLIRPKAAKTRSW